MLIGDFSKLIDEYNRSGVFGIEELDLHLGDLGRLLLSKAFSRGETNFWLMLSFLINQATEWDVLGIVNANAFAIETTVLHGRVAEEEPDWSRSLVTVGRPAIGRGKIELKIKSEDDLGMLAHLRAPAICFLAFADLAEFLEQVVQIRQNFLIGQAYALLFLLEPNNSAKCIEHVKEISDNFLTVFWINTNEKSEGKIVALFTVGVKSYEI